jgi:hypothetical protein
MFKKILKNLFKIALFFQLKELKKFKNIHSGEECYIFGGGNSLKHMDLAAFKDRKSIVMNYLPFHNNFDQLDCSYVSLIAPFFFSKYFGKYPKHFKKHQFLISKVFKDVINNSVDKNFFMNATNIFYIKRKNLTHVFSDFPDNKDSLSEEIDCFTGGLRFSIALAAYMGFSKVYLVGCDYTFEPASHHHWFEKGTGLLSIVDDYEKEFFSLAQRHLSITTVTLESESKVLPFITYKELTGRDPLYRENTDLISSEYLNILKLWPEFLID